MERPQLLPYRPGLTALAIHWSIMASAQMLDRCSEFCCTPPEYIFCHDGVIIHSMTRTHPHGLCSTTYVPRRSATPFVISCRESLGERVQCFSTRRYRVLTLRTVRVLHCSTRACVSPLAATPQLQAPQLALASAFASHPRWKIFAPQASDATIMVTESGPARPSRSDSFRLCCCTIMTAPFSHSSRHATPVCNDTTPPRCLLLRLARARAYFSM